MKMRRDGDMVGGFTMTFGGGGYVMGCRFV